MRTARRCTQGSHNIQHVTASAVHNITDQFSNAPMLTSLDRIPSRRPRLPRTKVNSLICAIPVLMMKVLHLCRPVKQPRTVNDDTNYRRRTEKV